MPFELLGVVTAPFLSLAITTPLPEVTLIAPGVEFTTERAGGVGS